MVCLVFDADTIRMLASLEFPDRIEDDHDAFHESTIKVVDVCFGEGDSDSGDSDYDGDGDENDDEESSYAGVGYCRITSLHRLYMILTMDSNARAMEDLHPMDHTSTEL
ncbi:hypothetical protein BDV27DRAFT_129732 [Aspergillus caelatus]|uniref:Uncharacterized protein n=1 Tax=Aspergillus caelatus TaxID=61420 RepID=A0A5N7A189_9EURO|nr:uncharacterized protein BDV27DRAFT_129732 [Aspergillus caelatus]KAE8363572.1 hypothetical protein BDV27DRAFT_129732 [Aspergillus caelatus]